MGFLSWIGPSALLASIAFVYAQNCQLGGEASTGYHNHSDSESDTTSTKSKFLISTKAYLVILFFVYVSGAIPHNPLFPKIFFRNNIFRFLYGLYCSEGVGYKYIKNVMHQHNSYMHSDYRSGVRALSGGDFALRKGPLYELYEDTARPAAAATAANNTGERISAAQFSRIQAMKREAAKEDATSGSTKKESKLSYPTARGDDYVDLTLLTQRQKAREGLLVIPMPIFGDNYSYLLVHLQSRKAVAVDPADVKVLLYFLKKVSDYLASNKGESDGSCTPNVELTEVLVTHKHWDHSGNNRELMEYATSEDNRQRHARLHGSSTAAKGEEGSASAATTTGPVLDYYVSPTLKIYGSSIDAPMAATDFIENFPNVRKAAEADNMPPPLLVAGDCIAVDTFFAPGHTKGHVCFVVGDAVTYEDSNSDSSKDKANVKCAVFTGDCLFSGGVGAFFELESTADTITVQQLFTEKTDGKRGILLHPATLQAMRPEDVYIYAGHEYTERLLMEIKQIIERQKRKPEAQPDEAAYASADAPAYLQNVTKALEEVAHLRKASDGLANNNNNNSSGSMRLPFCTMPSSLLLERRINPLVTLNPKVLEHILAKEKLAGGLESSNEIETAVYCSLNRQL